MMQFKIAISIFVLLNSVRSAKILAVFPTGTSHYILSSKFVRGLLKAGHDVTMISPYKLKDLPKYGVHTDVVLEGFDEDFDNAVKDSNLFDVMQKNHIEIMKMAANLFLDISTKVLHHPSIIKLVRSNQTFDVIIMEQFASDALKVFAHIYKCPLVILNCQGPNSWINPTVGNYPPVSYVGHTLLGDFSSDITFLKTITNLFYYMSEYIVKVYYSQVRLNRLIHDLFTDAPSIDVLYTNVSLVLLNSHTSIYPALPVVPNMIEIGGFFIDPPQKLPEDLQDFLDGATEGVIYFSLGTNLKSKYLPETKKKIIFNVLGKLKQKVLCKFGDELPDLPSNVMTKKWLPQQDVLAHPNIKIFITHAGLLSITEAIHFGVPILAIPVFGDQPANADTAVAKGYGVKLNYHDPNFTEETFSGLVNELLNNPKYRVNAQMISKMYDDRPLKPMETAVYWVEYVIKHKDVEHLKAMGVKMPWYQYFMVDLLAFVLGGLIIVFCALKCIVLKPKNGNK